jgi:tRNA A-37 threonylcarbamoyl transferase component Bud32
MQGYGELGAGGAVGKYRVVLQLGQGGTADVYLAAADGPGGFRKLVVLKVLKKSLAADEELRAMFLGEAKLAARLHHRNIVQTNEVLVAEDGRPVMVMEYLEGQPLSQVIVRGRQGGFTAGMQLRVLADALAGLHAAHEAADFDGTPLGVVHRDVSPHNIFVTVEGEAKVLDFGVAKIERSLVETEVGTIKGKLRYMAPEQIAGKKLDRRADVYAAGVILWEVLAGERMWQGRSEQEIRARVLGGDLPTPPAARPDVPRSLEPICRRALSLVPADRQATARELADDVERCLLELAGAVGHRDIGGTVARLFEDERARARAAIERSLAGMSPAAAAAAAPAQPPAVAAPAAAAAGGAPPAAQRPAPVRRWRRRVLLFAAASGVVAGVVAILGALGAWSETTALRGRPSSATVAPPGGGDAPAVTASPRPGQPVELTATGLRAEEPASAGVASPAEDLSPRDERARESGAGAAAGRAARAARFKRAVAAPVPAAGAGAPGASPDDCRHPFFVDADGIKKFRPECM